MQVGEIACTTQSCEDVGITAFMIFSLTWTQIPGGGLPNRVLLDVVLSFS